VYNKRAFILLLGAWSSRAGIPVLADDFFFSSGFGRRCTGRLLTGEMCILDISFNGSNIPQLHSYSVVGSVVQGGGSDWHK
jgi:hypothetical protein